jgi:tetratricopeptide (TPR) repeat protein
VFLTVASWKSTVSELALIVVLGQRGLDVEQGIEECVRLSLLERREFLDSQPAYLAPQLARLFGKKKLEGDADRLVVQEDLQILQKFGVLPTREPITVPQEDAVQRFLDWALMVAESDSAASRETLDGILESLSALWPIAWLTLARFRANGGSSEGASYAYRRAVEEMPASKAAHLERAAFAHNQRDEAVFIASRLRAVEIDPSDIALVRDVAWDVCKYITEHSADIPQQRRSVYVANLRDQMRVHSPRLDATGLSRLAWLYFLEGNRDDAWRYASDGLRKEQANQHCYRLIQRLREDGFDGEATN